jgi:hypothetical protein
MELQTVDAYQDTRGPVTARASSVLRGNIHNALVVQMSLEPWRVSLIKNFALYIMTTVVLIGQTQNVIAAQGNLWRKWSTHLYSASVFHVPILSIWTRIITTSWHVKPAPKAHTLRH